MHIMEGFLPHPWWEIWFALSLPVVAYGARRIGLLTREKRDTLPLLAVAGAFVFVLSSLKLPSMAGTCSHPTGTGIGAIMFGPAVTAVLATIVLVYQALFLAHGGITTLGANIFSMGIIGPAAGFLVYRALCRLGQSLFISTAIAAAFADMATYLMTSLQLALAFPATTGGVISSFFAFAAVFALTQVPLAIAEGVVTALIFQYILQARADMLLKMNVISKSSFDRIGTGKKVSR
jgi:cobalt/nickel transport system permease protein